MHVVSRFFGFLLFIVVSSAGLIAQEQDSFDLSAPEYVSETFKTYRIVNGHSVEMLRKKALLFTIGHRFLGTVDEGLGEFFGMDQFADIHLELAYGLTDRLNVGLGRSRVGKIYNGYFKYRLTRQELGGFPLSLGLVGGATVRTAPWSDTEADVLEFKHRLRFSGQALIAARVLPSLSVQLTPTYIHRNLTLNTRQNNQTFALGVPSRIRLSDGISLLCEYFPRFNPDENDDRQSSFNAFGFGLDITSAQHAYQIQFSNTVALTEPAFIAESPTAFGEKGVHLGFRITRFWIY
ncbi:MAG: hypothetical protein KIPDCIKN_04248 [Haliscomenobacter sp.]|nr:hypothetical protein [Haliscomenobacter sp.]